MKKYTFLFALLCASLMGWATQYCETVVQSTVDNTSVSIKATVKKSGEKTLLVQFESPLIASMGAGGCFQGWGDGATWQNQDDAVANFASGWTQTGNVWSKEFTFTTYPISGTGQIYALFNLTEGMPAVAGFTLTSVDLFTNCSGGSTPAPGEDPTPAASPYCNTEIKHQNLDNAAANSHILLSVGSDGQGHTIVNLKPTANNAVTFDYINIVGKKDVGSDIASGGAEEMTIVFPTPTPDGNGDITFTVQWSYPDWGGRYEFVVTVPANATCASADPFPGTNTYCKYTDNDLRSANANVTLTWATNAAGDVVITLGDGEGASNTHFRNEGFEYGGGKTMDDSWFVYSGTAHQTVEPASKYFTVEQAVNGGNTYALRLKDGKAVPSNAVIAFFGHAFSWKNDQNSNAYTENKIFAYDYGYNCPHLDAPTNVAVDGTKHITFDGVENAQNYTVYVYLDGIVKHRQVVSNGDELTFQPYTTGTYQVQVVADASGYPTSDPSAAYDWALTAPAIVVGNSEYCEWALPKDHDQDANLTVETNEAGTITITLSPVSGQTAVFREQGMKLSDFTVGAAHTAASAYFDRTYTAGGTTVVLTLKNASIKPGLGEKIYFNGYVECKVENVDTWPTASMVYTYGAKCSGQKHVSVAVNNNEMGSATVNGVAAVDVDENTQVTCVATPAEGYEFVNWTVGDAVVATTSTYQPTITAATSLVANFDYIRTTYCHTAVQTSGNKKVYLTVGKGATEGTYQIKIYGSDELTITGINNANTAINHVKYLTYDGNDVPMTVANGGWSYSSEGYGVITSAEIRPQTGYTWRDMWMWRPDLFMGTSAGEQVINSILDNEHYFNWDNDCADTEAPVFAKASGTVLDANSVRLTIQATDNWEGLLTYTIAREAAEPIISQHASGEEFTQDVTGLTTGTEYTFTVTVSDGVNNTNQNIVITPVGDETKPDMGEASLASKTWNKAIINVAATDNIGVVAYYIVELDADYVATEGKITVEGLTAATPYTFTIKAKDAAGNISDNAAEVSFTIDAHELVPTTAAPVPAWPADQVKSLYSNTYAFAPASLNSYNEDWWFAPIMEEGNVDGNTYLHYNLAADGIIGWQYDQISVASMEKVHIDIYASAAGTVTIRPITNGDSESINTQRKTLTLVGQEWNSFDVDLTEFPGHDWTKLFQFSIENWNAGGLTGEHISVDNVYFYRTTTLVDNEKPTNVQANVTKASFASIKLTVSGEDNSGNVIYRIKIGDTEYANGAAASGANKAFTLNGLTPGTNYNISVTASDESGNMAAPVNVAAQTNAITPAPVPAHGSAIIRSVYCDAFETALAHDFLKNTWTGIPYSELSLNGDHILAYSNPNAPAQMPDIAWGVNNDGADAIIAKDGFNDGTNKGLDVRNMQFIHFDIWSSVATNYPELRLNDTEAGHIVLDGSGWQSFDLDISSLTDEQKTNIRWIKFIALRDPAPEEIVIDNVYFWAYGVTANAPQGNESAGGWATFAAPVKLAVPDGVTAYKASYQKTETEEILRLIEITEDVIPANAGVILKGTAGADYIFTPTEAAAPDMSGNVLVGCAARTDVSAARATNDIFCMRYSELFNMTGFFLYEGQYVPAGKAYLALPKDTNNPGAAPQRRVRFVFDAATDIEHTGADTIEATKFIENGQLFIRRGDAVYTIQGMRVK